MLITGANFVAIIVEITLLSAVYVHTGEGCCSQHTNSKQDTDDNCSCNQENILHEDTDVAAESHLPTLLSTGIVTSIVVIRCL